MMKDKYYRVDLESKGNHGGILFWRTNGQGYTEDLKDAGLFEEPDFHGDTWSLTPNEVSKLKTVNIIPFYELSGIKTNIYKNTKANTEGTER